MNREIWEFLAGGSRRVMRTCRAMGLATVAVYSDADARAPFVQFADEAVRIGPPPARESYLVINALLDAARTTGAQAIHPGYGFLSENAQFAQDCERRGIALPLSRFHTCASTRPSNALLSASSASAACNSSPRTPPPFPTGPYPLSRARRPPSASSLLS